MSTRAAGWSRSRRGWSKTLSLPKILLDCELFRQCRRVRAGLTVDDDYLTLDVVADVGPGGHFLKAKQTRQHMRSGELYMPQLMLRELYDAWSIAKRGELERAVAAVEEMLAGPRPKPLPAGAAERIDEVIAAAGRELGGR